MARIHWSDIAGPERGGPTATGERQHLCLSCGKFNLWKNDQSGLWHCWSCGVSGRLLASSTLGCTPHFNCNLSDRDNDTEIAWITQTYLNSPRCIIDSTYEDIMNARLLNYPKPLQELFGIRSWHGSAMLPMYLDYDPCGVHFYDPSSGVRYRSEGTRGLAPAFHHRTRVNLLCEGLFDALQAALVLHKKDLDNVAQVWFTAGNSLTDFQVAEILARTREEDVVLLAFDNDKPGAAQKALARLFPYRQTHLCLPQRGWGKDWDDALKGPDQDYASRLLETWIIKGGLA
jgi:hypothetical protein